MRILIGGVGALSLALAAANLMHQPPSPSRSPRLFKDSRQSLAVARAQGRRDMTLVVATVAGQTQGAARDASKFGGEVRFRDDEAGYLRVRLPLDSVTRFSESPNVEAAAADYDESYPSRLIADSAGSAGGAGMAGLALAPGSFQKWNRPFQFGNELTHAAKPRTNDATPGADPGMLQARQVGSPAPWPPKLGDYPLRNPYSPLRDIGAADMLARNPTYDGRGVTIALLDGNLDLLLPEFQTAYTRDGHRVPKIADFLNVTDPRDDAALNPQWVDMGTEVDGSSGRALFDGKTFTLPRPGRYRIGFFDERRFNQPANAAYIDQDVDRDGNPKGDDGLFGVLWDERTNEVWVDSDRDLSFANEKAMLDYAKRGDVGVFGHDDPKTPIRESIGFAVQTDTANKFVSINLGIYQHATEIMGSVVGNVDPHGRVEGVAPGARLISMFYGVGNMHAAIEGLIRAFRDSRIDLIVFEQSVELASIPYLLADAHHPISVIVQRLAARYQKLLFVPGSNSPGFGIVAEDGLAPNVVSVGAYQSRDSYLANWGAYVAEHDNLHWGGLSHGPSGIGQAKPDLLAPSGQISTDPGYRAGALRRGLFRLPPGYSVDGGTSTATPMAAGATALVVSAAKQRGLRYDAPRLKAALQGSARYIPHLAANEQGAGLIQVAAALSTLEKLQATQLLTIDVRAPVRTVLSDLLATPNTGVGIYEREGWKPGDRGERTITLTRTSGPDEPMTFTLSWQGNDGTFTGPGRVVLPLGQAVPVVITVDAKTEGPHTAVLLVGHASLPVPAQRVLCTVVAAVPLRAGNGYAATATLTVPKPADRSFFVDVPPGVSALTISAPSSGGPARLGAVSPDRRQLNPCGYAPTSGPCAIANPVAGVWEINAANNDVFTFDDTSSRAPTPKQVSMTVAALHVDLDASPGTDWAKPDAAATFPVRAVNGMATVPDAAVAPAPLGSGFRVTRTIAQGDQHLYEVMVPEGAASIRARVVPADRTADLDVYLLDCATPPAVRVYERRNGGKAPSMPAATCVPRAAAAGREPGGEVEVDDPRPGRWVIVIDAYSVPGGTTPYEYMDVFTHSRFGSISLGGAAPPGDDRANGTSWTVPAHLWTASLPEPPRVLVGRVTVTSPRAFQTSATPMGQHVALVPLGTVDLVAGPPSVTQSSPLR